MTFEEIKELEVKMNKAKDTLNHAKEIVNNCNESLNLKFLEFIRSITHCESGISKANIEIHNKCRSLERFNYWYATVTVDDKTRFGYDITLYIFENSIEVNYGICGHHGKGSPQYYATKLANELLDCEDKIVDFANQIDLTYFNAYWNAESEYRSAYHDYTNKKDKYEYDKVRVQIQEGAIFQGAGRYIKITRIMAKTFEYEYGIKNLNTEEVIFPYKNQKMKIDDLISQIREDILEKYYE